MWSSRIFSLVRGPSARPSSSRLTCRSCSFTPVAAAIDRRDAARVYGLNCSSANNMHTTRSNNMQSHPTLSNYNINSLPFHDTRRYMSKFLSKSATKRLPLTTKRAGKGFYKGKGGTSEGRLTSKGKFIADPLKKLQLIVPDLKGFPLKPYIASSVSTRPPRGKKKQLLPSGQ